MKSSKTIRSCAARNNARVVIRALLVGFFSLDRQAWAQSILAPEPQAPDQTPAAVQQVNEMDVFATAPQTEAEPLKWGLLTLRPHPFYQYLDANGLQSGTNNSVHSVIQTISTGVLLQVGNYWTLDYTPLWSFYSNREFSDTFGQTASLRGGTTYKDWVLALSQSFADTSAPTAATAGQTRTINYATALDGLYAMNSKMSLDLTLNQQFESADQFSSYNEWSMLDWLNYQFWPRFSAGLGVGGGYVNESSSPDITFQQFQGRIRWRASDKVSFQLADGVEVDQFLSGGAAPLVNPIYSATIQYQPFEHTRFSVAGSEAVSASYLQGQVTETTGVTADLNQRLLGKLFLDLSGSYQLVKYVSSGNTSGSNRQDNLYTFNAQLSRTFLKRGTFAVLYQLSQDDSSQPGFSFNSHQVGFQISYSY